MYKIDSSLQPQSAFLTESVNLVRILGQASEPGGAIWGGTFATGQYYCHCDWSGRAQFMRKVRALNTRRYKTRCPGRNSLQKFAGSRDPEAATAAGFSTILPPAPASFLNLHCIYGTWSRAWADPA